MADHSRSSLLAALQDLRDGAFGAGDTVTLTAAGSTTINIDGLGVNTAVTIRPASGTSLVYPALGTSASLTSLQGMRNFHSVTFNRENGTGRARFGSIAVFQNCNDLTFEGGSNWNLADLTGVSVNSSTDTFTKTSHGLSAGQQVYVVSAASPLTYSESGKTGRIDGRPWFVSASGLTSSEFKLCRIASGTVCDVTSAPASISISTEREFFSYVTGICGYSETPRFLHCRWIGKDNGATVGRRHAHGSNALVFFWNKGDTSNPNFGSHITDALVQDFEIHEFGGDGVELFGVTGWTLQRGEISYLFDNQPQKVGTDDEDHNDGYHQTRGRDGVCDDVYFHHISYQGMWNRYDNTLFGTPDAPNAYIGATEGKNNRFSHMGKSYMPPEYNGDADGGGDAIGFITCRGPVKLHQNSQDLDTIPARGLVWGFENDESNPLHAIGDAQLAVHNNVLTWAKQHETFSNDGTMAVQWDYNVQTRARSLTVTSSSATHRFTASAVHGLFVRDRLVCTNVGNAGADLTANTSYWVQSVPSTTTFTISATINGALKTLTVGAGSGIVFARNFPKQTNDLAHGTAPEFTDPEMGDFAPASTSPILNVGASSATLAGLTIPVTLSTTDSAGNTRPLAATAPDLGAVEYQSAAAGVATPVASVAGTFASLSDASTGECSISVSGLADTNGVVVVALCTGDRSLTAVTSGLTVADNFPVNSGTAETDCKLYAFEYRVGASPPSTLVIDCDSTSKPVVAIALKLTVPVQAGDVIAALGSSTAGSGTSLSVSELTGLASRMRAVAVTAINHNTGGAGSVSGWDNSFSELASGDQTYNSADAAPSFLAASSADSGNGSSTATLTMPATTYAENDIVVVALTHSGTRSHTAPVDETWTVIEATNESGDSTTSELTSYYHRLTSGEATSWTSSPPSRTWTLDSSSRWAIGGVAVRGVDATTALDVTETENTGTATTSCVGTGVTTATDNAMLLLAVGHNQAVGTNTFTSSDVTERVDDTSNLSTTCQSIFMGTTVQASAGASGNKTATSSQTGNFSAQLIALRPAASATTKDITLAVASRAFDSGGSTGAVAATGTPTGDTLTVMFAVRGNTVPVANAGTDANATTGVEAFLNGAGSADGDGDALTYAWTQTAGDAVTINDSTLSVARFTAATAGVRTFQLSVTDAAGDSDTDSVTFTVSAPAAGMETRRGWGRLAERGPLEALTEDSLASGRGLVVR